MLRTLDEKVSPQHAAVVIVDMQNDFCHEDGASGRDGNDMSRVKAIVPTLQRLIDGAHKVGAPVLFTQAVHDEWTNSEVRMERRADKSLNCVKGTWGADFYGVKPETEDLIIEKSRYSAFIGTNLELVLRTKNIRTLIMTGTTTSICVESTAREAFMRDFYVVIAEDGCAENNVAAHDASLRRLNNTFGIVADADDILRSWNEHGNQQTQR